jgi:PAS domain-containing protein
MGSPRTRASSSAADTADPAEPAEPEPEPEDLGLAPFFPADAAQGECWESLKQRGMLREVADLLMTNSPDGYTVGKGQHFIYASPGALRTFRATKEQLLSTAVADLMHPDDRARTMEEWSEALETSVARGGEPVYRTYNYRLRCCDSDPASPTFFWSQSSSIVLKTAAPGDEGQWCAHHGIAARLRVLTSARYPFCFPQVQHHA